ncbi:MAG TPA: aminobenzoyl-glutamate transporter [Planctomycetaceae bacterium]|nr:aminobenzoyl-glutamate transporter [Planctomycetaceae bacterium]
MNQRVLDTIERLGNRLPDPALLFVWALLLVWVLSALLSPISFEAVDPATGQPIRVVNQLTSQSLVNFLTRSVKTFVEFPPLGLVLVAMLGVGVAEQAGLIQAGLKALLKVTPKALLTPALLFVGLLSHAAGDSGYVVVIPLGAVMFAAAGRHPLLGLTTAFAGVSGGFSACLIPAGLDPLLQGFTQKAAQIIDPTAAVNPLCNWFFMSGSVVVIVLVGWYVTDRIIEPRVASMKLDGTDPPQALTPLSPAELRGLLVSLAVLGLMFLGLAIWIIGWGDPWRGKNGQLMSHDAPLMQGIVPLLFVLFLVPGVTFGAISGSIRTHRDVIQAMSKSMGAMSYYMVMAFFAAQFTAAFKESNLGVLTAVNGALFLQKLNLPPEITIVAIILMTAVLDLLVGSASAKWALLAPILVPMLMSVGISPDLTQAAYRIGDSTVNIVTPLMPYFPLVVVYAQRYVKSVGIGTMVSLMIPYSLLFLLAWTLLLLAWWTLGLPLGLGASYTWPR